MKKKKRIKRRTFSLSMLLLHRPLAMLHISEPSIDRCSAIAAQSHHKFGPVEVKSVQAEKKMTRTAHSTKVLETPPPMRHGIVMVIQSVAPAHAKLGWDHASLRPPHLIHDTAAALSSILPPANARPADCAAQHYLLFQTTTTTWQSSGAKKKKN